MQDTQEKSPAFRWYPKDILTSIRVQMMTMEEECAYRRAIDYCWIHGRLPAAPEKLALVIGKNCSVELAETVRQMFIADPKDAQFLVHERLEIEKKKQKNWRRKSSEGGKKSADARRAKAKTPIDTEICEEENGVKGGSTTVEANGQPKGNISFSFPFSTTNKNISGGGEPAAAAANSPPGVQEESAEDYLLRKQLEYPKLDVAAVYRDFRTKCGSDKYPNLRNTRYSFDKWLDGESPTLDVPVNLTAEQPRQTYVNPTTGQGLL